MMNRIKQLEWKIDYLQRAGDSLENFCLVNNPHDWIPHIVDIWRSAKEN